MGIGLRNHTSLPTNMSGVVVPEEDGRKPVAESSSNNILITVKFYGKIKKRYKPANTTLKNRGHDITLHWGIGTAGSIRINGTKYALDQSHWHSPSEHTINGKRFALELHMVHRNLELGKTVVVHVLYKIGGPDSFLKEVEIKIGMVNPRNIKTGGGKYYRYLGSLTTPPCTEGVIWTINRR
ncbi:hypothetical protein MKX01_011379, partial [Papaver californicum]